MMLKKSIYQQWLNHLDRVSSISKDGPLEYITISLDGDDFAILPNFKKGVMYKGMKTDRRYTLKELGL